MKAGRLLMLLSALAAMLAVAMADPAAARTKYDGKRHPARVVQCRDDGRTTPWTHSWWNRTAPRWNGCSPPVYSGGMFIGQDPDPNIRHGLQRDPDTGYTNRY